MYSAKILTDNGDIFLDFDHGIIFDISPLSGVDVTLQRTQNYSPGIGESVGGHYTGGVTRTVRGVITSGRATQVSLFNKLTPGTSGRLVVDDRCWCRFVIKKTPMIAKEKSGRITFSMQLFCPLPYWCVGQAISGEFNANKPSFMFPVNYSDPHTFGIAINDSFLKITNSAGIITPFELSVVALGNVSNPQIYDAYRGTKLAFELSLSAGDSIVFSSYDGVKCEITEDGRKSTTNKYISDDSNLFFIPPGESILKTDADIGRGNMVAVLTYQPSTMGVDLE